MSRQVVPNKTEMRRFLRLGLTQQQIAEAWEAETGVRVSRAAIAMAIARYGLQSTHSRPRYEETIPWKLRPEHQNDHNARMLRLEGRRRRGLPLTDQEARWLAAYVDNFKQRGIVVTYTPDLGFVWMQRNEWDDPNDIIRVHYDNRPKDRAKGGRRTTAG